MHPRWLALLLALVLSFSGCLGFLGEDDPDVQDEEEDDPTDAPEDGPETDPDQETEEPDEVENETNAPPEASLAANLTSGEAPFNVSFTLDGSDADEDPLTWTLDLGDGNDVVEGDELPATYDHTFEQVGNFTVEFTVSDGEEQDNRTVVIEVDEAAVHEVIEGSFLLGNPLQGCVEALYTAGPDNGVTYFGTALEESMHGLPYSVEFSSTAPALGYLVGFAEGSSLETDTTNGPDPEPSSTITGTVPDGAETIVVSACGGAMIDVTITIG